MRQLGAPRSSQTDPNEVKTLVGLNRVSFLVPEITRDPALQDVALECEVKAGDNSFNAVLPPVQAAAP